MIRSMKFLVLSLLTASAISLALVGVTSLAGIDRIIRAERHEVEVSLTVLKNAYALRSAVHQRAAQVRGYVITGDAGSLVERQGAIVNFDTALAGLGTLGSHPELRRDVAALSQRFQAHTTEVIALRQAGKRGAAEALIKDRGEPLKTRLDDSIDTLIAHEAADVQALHAQVGRIEHDTRMMVLGALAVALPLFLLLATVLWRRMIEPLRDLTEAAQAVGDGKLTYRAPLRHQDEFGTVVTAFNAMTGHVAEAVEQLQAANEELTVQSEELQSQQEELQAQQEELQAANEELQSQQEELQHQADDLRQANDQLREADGYKDEFLSVLGHELRTPLNFISGFASILDDEIGGPLSAPQHEYIGKILMGTERMLSLVNDLLDVARIRAGKLAVEPSPLDYAALVQETLGEMQPLADERGVNLVVEVPATPGIEADGRRIHQVLINLLTNALKFTPRGGQVTVRVSIAQDQLLTEVSDTGIGIPEAELPEIFVKFQQVDMSTTRSAGGLGLGLAICKALIEAHQGSISVSSRLGTGSTFRFSLPLAAQQG